MGIVGKVGLVVGGLLVLYTVGVMWEKSTGQLDNKAQASGDKTTESYDQWEKRREAAYKADKAAEATKAAEAAKQAELQAMADRNH